MVELLNINGRKIRALMNFQLNLESKVGCVLSFSGGTKINFLSRTMFSPL